MEFSNQIARSPSSGLALLLAATLASSALAIACGATPRASGPPATSAPVATTSENVDKLTHTHPKLDFTVVQRWHLCDIDDLPDCTEQCATGFLPSCVRLANIYIDGKRVKQDLARAAQILDLPCDLGMGVACSNIAGIRAHDHDAQGAATYYERGCDDGDDRGCDRLGRAYAEGDGVPVDEAKAARLYKKSCDEESPEGCTDLAWVYLFGKGVAADPARARDLYARACEGGNAWACGNLGSMYTEGTVVTRDVARGQGLHQRACDGGVKNYCALLKEEKARK